MPHRRGRMLTDGNIKMIDRRSSSADSEFSTASHQRCDALASRIIEACRDRDLFVAAAESLTGGLLADAFVRIPGASDVFLGSAVTYDIAAKASILNVDERILDSAGAVDARVAVQMAESTARLFGREDIRDRVFGLSTTGVAGPGPDGDKPAGLVYVGLHSPIMASQSRGESARTVSYRLRLQGSREEVRLQTVEHVLGYLESELRSATTSV